MSDRDELDDLRRLRDQNEYLHKSLLKLCDDWQRDGKKYPAEVRVAYEIHAAEVRMRVEAAK